MHTGVSSKVNWNMSGSTWILHWGGLLVSWEKRNPRGCCYKPKQKNLPETEMWTADIGSDISDPFVWRTRASTASDIAHLPALTHPSSPSLLELVPSLTSGEAKWKLLLCSILPLGQRFFAIRNCRVLLVLTCTSRTHFAPPAECNYMRHIPVVSKILDYTLIGRN